MLKRAFELEEDGQPIGVPFFFTRYAIILKWSGRTLVWCLIEILVFLFYLTSLSILTLKSRFTNITPDLHH